MLESSGSRNISGSSHTTTDCKCITRNLRFIDLSEDSGQSDERGDTETPSELLKRHFSTSSAGGMQRISVAAAAAVAAATAVEPKEDLRIIGIGSCGTIYEIPGTEMVMKKGRDGVALYKDFRLTNRVHYAVEAVRTLLQQEFPKATIPRCPACREFYAADDKNFWSDSLKRRFPVKRRAQEPVFVATRILPLPKAIREALIELYFDESEIVQEEAKDDQDNKHCLVRIYLGEHETIHQQNECRETLRNFEMRLNIMENIGLDLIELGSEMAIGLAIIHWQAQVDAMDSEFVLGSSATWDNTHGVLDEKGRASSTLITFYRREIHLWMLDFDKASAIDLTEEDVDRRLVPAFVENDPYFLLPRDNDDDRRLWGAFSATYLKASEVILKAKLAETGNGRGRGKEYVMRLPQLFLAKVKKRVRENVE